VTVARLMGSAIPWEAGTAQIPEISPRIRVARPIAGLATPLPAE